MATRFNFYLMIIGMKVLVLHANALQVGFLGCYGNAWVATPNLDAIYALAKMVAGVRL